MEGSGTGWIEVVGVVLDNSVVISLIASDEDAKYSERVFQSGQAGDRLLAPAFCMIEFGNAILTCVRRQRMTRAEAWTAHTILSDLPIVFGGGLSFAEISAVHDLALSCPGLSFYDAVYLRMAILERARLATLDMALRSAAGAQGIEVFE